MRSEHRARVESLDGRIKQSLSALQLAETECDSMRQQLQQVNTQAARCTEGAVKAATVCVCFWLHSAGGSVGNLHCDVGAKQEDARTRIADLTTQLKESNKTCTVQSEAIGQLQEELKKLQKRAATLQAEADSSKGLKAAAEEKVAELQQRSRSLTAAASKSQLKLTNFQVWHSVTRRSVCITYLPLSTTTTTTPPFGISRAKPVLVTRSA